MSEPAIDPASIRTALDQARQTGLQIDACRAANSRTISTLEAALKGALNGPLTPASRPADSQTRHTEIRSRIEADDELRACILARIRTLTFDQVLAEVAARFPSERCPSRSALHRWWHRYGRNASTTSS